MSISSPLDAAASAAAIERHGVDDAAQAPSSIPVQLTKRDVASASPTNIPDHNSTSRTGVIAIENPPGQTLSRGEFGRQRILSGVTLASSPTTSALTSTTTATEARQRALALTTVRRLSDLAHSVARLIALKMIEPLSAAAR